MRIINISQFKIVKLQFSRIWKIRNSNNLIKVHLFVIGIHFFKLNIFKDNILLE
jgi:hypothetical protein